MYKLQQNCTGFQQLRFLFLVYHSLCLEGCFYPLLPNISQQAFKSTSLYLLCSSSRSNSLFLSVVFYVKHKFFWAWSVNKASELPRRQRCPEGAHYTTVLQSAAARLFLFSLSSIFYNGNVKIKLKGDQQGSVPRSTTSVKKTWPGQAFIGKNPFWMNAESIELTWHNF